MNQLYDDRGTLAVGFHGCRREVAEALQQDAQIAIRNMNCIKGVFLPRQERACPADLND